MNCIQHKAAMDDMGSDDSAMNDASLLDGMEMEGDEEMLISGGDDGVVGKPQSLKLQSLLALQELGIVIAVALMVGIIFMMMILLEKTMNSVSEFYNKRFGEGEEEDVEDPAALVGTFKRYKN